MWLYEKAQPPQVLMLDSDWFLILPPPEAVRFNFLFNP